MGASVTSSSSASTPGTLVQDLYHPRGSIISQDDFVTLCISEARSLEFKVHFFHQHPTTLPGMRSSYGWVLADSEDSMPTDRRSTEHGVWCHLRSNPQGQYPLSLGSPQLVFWPYCAQSWNQKLFFFFGGGGTRVWTQGLTLAIQALLALDPLHHFWDMVLQTICPGWLRTMILLISASLVARITGMSHQRPALNQKLLT
jgi:hypothetical protein